MALGRTGAASIESAKSAGPKRMAVISRKGAIGCRERELWPSHER